MISFAPVEAANKKGTAEKLADCHQRGTNLFREQGAAQARPPFVTDDPGLPPVGGWEINVPFILERTAGGTEMNALLVDLNYGLPNVQLKLEGPVAVVHDDHDGTAAGPDDRTTCCPVSGGGSLKT